MNFCFRFALVGWLVGWLVCLFVRLFFLLFVFRLFVCSFVRSLVCLSVVFIDLDKIKYAVVICWRVECHTS